MKKTITILACLGAVFLGACQPDAYVASQNLSTAADMFEINRRIVFINGITDKYLMTVEGLCSIKADRADKQLEVTCKTGAREFKKHFLGISDNVTYLVEQLEPAKASVYHHRIIFKPQSIIPDIDLKGSVEELKPRDNY